MNPGKKNLSLTDARRLVRFGLTGCCFFALLAGLAWHKAYPSAPWWFGASLASGILALARPKALAPAEAALLKVGEANTFFLLALVYYLVVTPVALALRWFRRDPLGLHLKMSRSYWKDKPPIPSQAYMRQF